MLNKNLNNQKSPCYNFKLLNEKEIIGTGKKNYTKRSSKKY